VCEDVDHSLPDPRETFTAIVVTFSTQEGLDLHTRDWPGAFPKDSQWLQSTTEFEAIDRQIVDVGRRRIGVICDHQQVEIASGDHARFNHLLNLLNESDQ